tara:strand:- start:1127 stop:1930 length:804 start_codon:yes stop_codon:yes gene_type:complete
MKKFKEFLVEADASPSQYYGAKLGGIDSGSIFPTISGEGGGAGVIVSNPTGESSTRSSLGMGFELAPQLTGTVQQFVNQYGDKTDNSAVSKAYSEKIKSKFNLTAQDKVVTWQIMNKAVSNQQTEELNKLLVKYNLKSSTDNPQRAWGDDDMDEYYRWVDQQMQEWELGNPRPEWVDGMSQEEWEAMMREWETRQFEHRHGIEHWYAWNIPGTNGHTIGSIPQRNPLPMPKPRNPTTWSPKPWWAPESPPNNPNWWHWGPDGSDRPV